MVQEYINRPILINGLKFDFRIYILVQSLNPFVAFIAKENLARFCVEKYKVPRTSADMR